MTHTEFANFSATMCARMIGSCDPATRRQSAATERALARVAAGQTAYSAARAEGIALSTIYRALKRAKVKKR